VVASGRPAWTEGDPTAGTLEAPAATIPLLLAGRAVGLVAIFATFEQKTAFVDVDHELFRLIGGRAGAALAAARLFSVHGDGLGPVEAFIESE
jgi:GAF domain-containing protein